MVLDIQSGDGYISKSMFPPGHPMNFPPDQPWAPDKESDPFALNQARPVAIFDIDGTLSDPTHRQYLLTPELKHWDEFFNASYKDKPIFATIRLLGLIRKEFQVFILTGRPQRVRHKTEAWLRENGVLYDRLYMRADTDHRDATVFKLDILKVIQAEGQSVHLAFEDDDKVVAMWRENGVNCLQVHSSFHARV